MMTMETLPAHPPGRGDHNARTKRQLAQIAWTMANPPLGATLRADHDRNCGRRRRW